MSVSYSYVNHDKRQFFTCGLFGSARFASIGFGPSARAVAILLSERGTWSRDRISIVGDSSEEFSDLQWTGLDIEVEVVLMLVKVDGLEWIEAELDDNVTAFSFMCNLAFHLRPPDVVKLLDTKFGVGKWQQRYESGFRVSRPDIWTQKIIEARDRGLEILVQS